MSTRADQDRSGGGKRERTRAALVAATLAVVAERGFAGASLDEIAARAGMTKGAVYSNFGSKAELLLAAIGAKGLTLEPMRSKDVTLREHLEAMAGELADMLTRARGEAAFLAEFQLYALGDPEVRRSLASLYAQSFAGNAEFLTGTGGLAPGVSARRLAVAIQSVGIGFMVQSFLSPDEVTEAVIRETLMALADAAEGASGAG